MRLKQIGLIDGKYINLAIVYSKHIKFLEILPFHLCMTERKICSTLSLYYFVKTV